MNTVFGIIQPSNKQFWVEHLEDHRTAGAFTFLGRYRTLDFPISNMTNSDIERIQVYIKRKPGTLVEHLGSGRHYGINSKTGKLQLLFSQNSNDHDVYNTDISSYIDNLEAIEKMTEEYVIIAPSYMVYRANYRELLENHIESGADITLLYKTVHNAKEAYLNCHVLNINKQAELISIGLNQGTDKTRNIFMETYVLKKELLLDLIIKAKKVSSLYRLADIINDICTSDEEDKLDIRCKSHTGYLAAITDFSSYYHANIELINPCIAKDLFKPDWPIYTKTNDSCPTKYGMDSQVKYSVISNGCEIDGTVEGSVLSRECKIKKGAIVKNCVLSSKVIVGEDVHIENLIVDKYAKIEKVKEVIGNPEKIGYVTKGDKL